MSAAPRARQLLLAAAALVTCAVHAAPDLPPPGSPSLNSRGDGPAPPAAPFSVSRVDPAIDAIVPRDAKLELLANGFGLNEGSVWFPHGKFLVVSSLIDNVFYKIAADKTVSVFMEKAGYSGNDPEHVGTQTRAGRSHVLLIGPNCAGLDSQERLIWCANDDRTLNRLEKDGSHTVLSKGFRGRRFNGPNDIAIRRDDGVYLADNDFGLRGAMKSPDKQMLDGIWLIRNGETRLMLDEKQLGGLPNGIMLSPDEHYLYLSAVPKLWRYDVKPDGSLGDRTLFGEGPGIGDGIKVDVRGDVYSSSGSSPGRVRVMAPDGKLLGYLNMPVYHGEPKRQICVTNLSFGGADNRDLFISACDAVYRLRLNVPGVTSGPGH